MTIFSSFKQGGGISAGGATGGAGTIGMGTSMGGGTGGTGAIGLGGSMGGVTGGTGATGVGGSMGGISGGTGGTVCSFNYVFTPFISLTCYMHLFFYFYKLWGTIVTRMDTCLFITS